MTTSKPNHLKHGQSTGLTRAIISGVGTALVSGFGTGVAAAISGDSFLRSTVVVGAGAGLLSAGISLFRKPDPLPISELRLHPDFYKMLILGLAATEFGGATLGYIGTKLANSTINASVLFRNVTLGLPISCALLLTLDAISRSFSEATESNIQQLSPS